MEASESGTLTSFHIVRAISNNDPQDRPFLSGPNPIIWAIGTTPDYPCTSQTFLKKGPGAVLGYHGSNRGEASIDFLAGATQSRRDTSDVYAMQSSDLAARDSYYFGDTPSTCPNGEDGGSTSSKISVEVWMWLLIGAAIFIIIGGGIFGSVYWSNNRRRAGYESF